MDPSSGAPRPAAGAGAGALQPPTPDDAPIPIASSSHAEGVDVTTTAATVTAETTGAVTDLDLASGAQHLARFEFSPHGTKILMVEWYPGAVGAGAAAAAGSESDPEPGRVDAGARTGSDGGSSSRSHAERDTEPSAGVSQHAAGAGAEANLQVSAAVNWEVSWPGKATVVPVVDADTDADADADVDSPNSRRRVYFLLPPNAPIPTTVTVSAPSRQSLTLKPLPAIFPQGFSPEAGPQGVLHTLWARQRLSELEREMEAEMRANAESVGLEMALAEKQWIMDNFISPPPHPPVPSPASNKAIVTGRLVDKLKGLKLATSPADLAPSSSANTFTQAGSQSHTLSPQPAAVAVPSLSAVARGNLPTAAAPMSLDAALRGDPTAASAPVRLDSQDADDDLFALPMSPRSPDMVRSPFSAL